MNSSPAQLIPDRLPILALHNIVIFPLLAISITARRPEDIELLLDCQQKNELIAIANQRRPGALPLTYENIYPVGTACRISQAKLNSASQLEAVLEGVCRVSFLRLLNSGKQPQALIAGYQDGSQASDSTTQMLMESALSLLKACCAAGHPLPESATSLLDRISNPGHLADLIIIYLQPNFTIQQQALSLTNPKDRLKLVHQLL